MGARWIVLGAGSILPRAGYGPAGYALRTAPGAGVTLFDCGPGTVRSLAAAGVALEDVRRVVLSHLHPDHCLDLLALLFARRSPHLAGRIGPLELVASERADRLLEGGRTAFGRWVEDPELRRVLAHPDAAGRVELELDDLLLRGTLTGHTPDALAWRAELAGGPSVTFSGDTGEVAEVARLARETDLFCCECSFEESARVAGHLTPAGAGRLARAAGARRLILTHFYPGTDPERARAGAAREFGGPVEVARDGAVFALDPAERD